MRENKYQLLCTNAVGQSLIEKAAEQGIVIHVLAFIETESVPGFEPGEIILDLSRQAITAVFTSLNAVEAVKANLENIRPPWKIWCTAGATQKSVREYFGEGSVAGSKSRAVELAESISANGAIEELVFFCGNMRRNELPEMLREQGIRVREIIVYKTSFAPHRVTSQYDGILFFSPSAVHSFFSVNDAGEAAVLFAIGKTTADTIKTYSDKKVIMGESPGKELLIGQALAYFQTHPIQQGSSNKP